MIEQKVLIADDNANILKLLNLTFTLRKKFKIITAVNREEALKIAKNEKPDIIILDVLMPVMTGWEALKEIKKDPDIKNTPVIMLTALSDKNDVSKGYSIGAFDFITKPFNPNDLYNLVEKLLAKKKLKIEKEPDSDKIFSVIFIGADKKNDELLQNFFSNRHISIKGYLKVNASKYTFFDKLGIELIENIDKIPEIKELDFIIDSENNLSTSFKKKLADRSVKIISGSLRDFLCFLLRESNKQIKSRQEYAREVNLNLKNLNFLNNLYSRTSKALSTENFAHISSESLMEITKAQSSLFFLYDSSSSRFRKITNKNITGPESIVPDEILNKTSGNNIYPSLTTDTEKIKSILKVLRINTACKLIISIPLLAKKNYLGLLLLFNKKYENYDKNTIELLKTTALQLSAGLENIKLLELSKEKQKLVENLLSKVVTIQEDERQRISSDIHDSISQ